MGFKKILKRVAQFIIASQPDEFVKVELSQINYGECLKNKNIVVTGGGRGLGYQMAKKFVSEGANVLIAGRNEERLKSVSAELGTAYIVHDVSDASSAESFLSSCSTRLGGVDCLVSNAGISLHEGNFMNVTIEGFDRQFDINMRGNYFLCKAFLEMKLADQSTNASLLIISSETADQVYDIPYGMTKAAVNSMMRAFSRRVYRQGIRVNAIAPGVTLTDMTKEYAARDDGNLYRDCPCGRVFVPEEVAEVACFLLSDASKCISGEVIHTNAGNHFKTFWD